MKVDRDICVGCGACVNLCPRLAIRFIDGRSFIDQQSCIECGTCRDACGVDAIAADCRFPDISLLTITQDHLQPSEQQPFGHRSDKEQRS